MSKYYQMMEAHFSHMKSKSTIKNFQSFYHYSDINPKYLGDSPVKLY